MMLSFHAMASIAFKTPELALDPKEAQTLGVAWANVAKYYPTVIDEKQLAWFNLFTVMVGVYGTRAVAVGIRRKRERAYKASTAAPPNVVNFNS
jgi:hypothetical protein